LLKNSISRQKLRITALQRDKLLWKRFISDVYVYSSDMFVFLDETGGDRRNTRRKYGYSLRGRRPVNQQLVVKGQWFSAQALISTNNLLDVQVIKELLMVILSIRAIYFPT